MLRRRIKVSLRGCAATCFFLPAPAATSQKSSGMPSIKSPESVVFQVVDRFVAVTRGMPSGLRRPKTNDETPMRKRQVGGDCSVVFILCLLSVLVS
jgi:hypothetical protein